MEYKEGVDCMECPRAEQINTLTTKVAVLESKMDGVEQDLDEINKKLSNFTWWFISILTSSVGGMIVLLYQLKG